MKNLSILTLLFVFIFNSIYSQTIQFDYKRSSMHLVLIESETFPKKDLVIKAWNGYPFPENYNNHTVDSKSFNPSKYSVTDAERDAAGIKKSNETGKAVAGVMSDVSGGILGSNDPDMPVKIQKFINETKLANQLVAKWFNRTKEGKLDFKYIELRSKESASEEIKTANVKVGDFNESIYDEELIGGTFVVFNKLTFVENEPVARAVRDAAITQASKISMEMLRNKAVETANKAYEIGKVGYSVWTKVYLYQLVWNDQVADSFKKTFLKEGDPTFGAKDWENSDLFKLKFIGDENTSSLVTFSLKEKRTEEKIIELSTIRNIDNVFSKLQRKYLVFRPVTPISSIDPITAKIGLKEGIEAGDKFEVLKRTKDKKTNKPIYESIATVKVDKGVPIFDNLYRPAGEPKVDDAGNPIVGPGYTTFSGGNKNVKPLQHFLRLLN